MSKYTKWFVAILCVAVVATLVDFGPFTGKYWFPVKRGLDLAGGMRITLEARPERGQKITNEVMNAAVLTVRRRIDTLGVSEPVVQWKRASQITGSGEQIIVEIPDIKQKQKALELIQETGALEFWYMKNVGAGRTEEKNLSPRFKMDVSADNKYSFRDVMHPTDPPITSWADIKEKIFGKDAKPEFTGKDLKAEATSGFGQGNQPAVYLVFTDEGQERFTNFTRKHTREYLAITLDGDILTVPLVKDVILTSPEISGSNTLAEAQELAELLNAGALPVPLEPVQSQSIEATLGRESVKQSIVAGIVGIIAVLIFMLVYYRLPGLIADVALALYALFAFAAFKLVGVTMTLPGLAGFILSIGMAVDANVLIFERLKEELRSGKTLRAAIDAGFSRAFTSIFDSNMCTLITCAILFGYGTGPVAGFALTLAIGVIISMFTAITVTRTILHLLVGATWLQAESTAVWLFGLKDSWIARSGRHFDIIGKRAYYFLFSALVILPGAFFWYSGGIKKGIEFTGGASVAVKFDKPVSNDEVIAAMSAIGYEGSQAQMSGRSTAFIRLKKLDIKVDKSDPERENYAKARTFESRRIQSELGKRVGEFKLLEFSEVGPSISKELTTKAFLAIVLASLAIVAYLTIRFAIGGFLTGLKFGTCAVIALIHDVLVVVGAAAIFGRFLGWEIDSLFVTALLTMIGFSVHDTIVVFDRIRENLKHRLRDETFEQLANRSILQTFARSVNTSLTVVLTLLALFLFGGPIIKHFIAALLVGIISGTYSSIFNATPLVVVWENLANKKGRGSRQAADRPLVSGDRVKELRPIATAKPERVASEGEIGEAPTPSAGKPKAKAKKKKRRY